MSSDFQLPDSAHRVMHEGLAYWRQAHPGGGLLPGRQHIDPLSMPRLLPYAWLLEVHPPADDIGIPRFRFRLAGSHVDLGFGGPKTGRWLHEMEPDFESSPAMQSGFVATATEGRISHRRGRPRFAMNAAAAELERLMLPLAGNGRDIDMLLGFTVFYEGNGAELHAVL